MHTRGLDAFWRNHGVYVYMGERGRRYGVWVGEEGGLGALTRNSGIWVSGGDDTVYGWAGREGSAPCR